MAFPATGFAHLVDCANFSLGAAHPHLTSQVDDLNIADQVQLAHICNGAGQEGIVIRQHGLVQAATNDLYDLFGDQLYLFYIGVMGSGILDVGINKKEGD